MVLRTPPCLFPHGNSEHYSFFSGVERCGKVKRIHYERARPHELPKVISSTMLRCYGVFMRLCQFPLLAPPRSSSENKFMATVLGSIVVFLSRGRARIFFAESFLSGLWFHWTRSTSCHGVAFDDDESSVHFLIKKFRKRRREKKTSNWIWIDVVESKLVWECFCIFHSTSDRKMMFNLTKLYLLMRRATAISWWQSRSGSNQASFCFLMTHWSILCCLFAIFNDPTALKIFH